MGSGKGQQAPTPGSQLIMKYRVLITVDSEHNHLPQQHTGFSSCY
jgi:hypothetical protein